MTRDDTLVKQAVQAGVVLGFGLDWDALKNFAKIVAAAERNKVAAWMIERSYATGHGDTTEDLLKELEWQVRESEREACAKVCESVASDTYGMTSLREYGECAAAIRARNDKARSIEK